MWGLYRWDVIWKPHTVIHVNFNTLRPGYAIWRQKSGSTVARVIAWCTHHGAIRQRVIARTNVDLSPVMSFSIYLRTLSYLIPISKIRPVIAFSKSLPDVQGINGLKGRRMSNINVPFLRPSSPDLRPCPLGCWYPFCLSSRWPWRPGCLTSLAAMMCLKPASTPGRPLYRAPT